MSKTATNLAATLGIIIIVFGGWFLYSQVSSSSTSVEFENSQQVMDEMRRKTSVYTQRGNILRGISLQTDMFEDERFTTLVDFGQPIDPVDIGRPDPFADVNPE